MTLDEALTQLGEADPGFNEEIRRRLRPVRDRFFTPGSPGGFEVPSDGLHTAPTWLTDPECRQVAIGLAELALARGIDVNVPCEPNGSTFLHGCVLLRDPAIAADAVAWLLHHGADPNRKRDDGETPLSLAVKLGRTEIAEQMRTQSR